MSHNKIIIIVSIALLLFGNFAFIFNVKQIYPLNMDNALFLLSLPVFFVSALIFLLGSVCHKYTIKLVLIIIIILSANAAYFMDSYNVIINDEMIDNMVQTNTNEMIDLIGIKYALYLLVGIFVSVLIYKTKLIERPFIKELGARVKLLAVAMIIFISIPWLLSDFYASFIREHKILRSYFNPGYYIYSVGKYINSLSVSEQKFITIANDAEILSLTQKPKLSILIVGETARADHFSLNGYGRITNQWTNKLNVTSFTNMHSCGTSTAVSVPCMFSIYDRSNYNKNKAYNTQNVLDVLSGVGVNVVWIDNNSSSKGVAERIPYYDYRGSKNNSICDSECRDIGMIADIEKFIQIKQNNLIVLHQMGNHGPAYYKRYPKSFAKFQPECKTNQLQNCSNEQITNSYDNAIRYTDYFLAKTIELLQKYDKKYDVSMIYISDHGESLGENNIYLHGLPYFVAPKNQTHIPMIIWQSVAKKYKTSKYYTHANLFHSLLGLFNVKTMFYDKSLDIFD